MKPLPTPDYASVIVTVVRDDGVEEDICVLIDYISRGPDHLDRELSRIQYLRPGDLRGISERDAVALAATAHTLLRR